MGNESEGKAVFGAEDPAGADALLRKMAKRGLSELQVKQVTDAAKEQLPGEQTLQQLIRMNFLKAARLRQSREMSSGATSQ